MFPLPYLAPFSSLLYGLFGLDVLLLLGGLTLGPFDAGQLGRLPLPLRLCLSAILAIAAFVQWRLVGSLPLGGYARWISLGMALGFLGDLVMARLILVPDRLICGALVFGLGHIAYIVALAGVTAALDLWFPPLNLSVWALAGLIGVALWYGFVRKPGGDPRQNLAALMYGLLMATMNALAISLAARQAAFIPLALGAVLFLTSDLLIGNWSIRGHAWKRVNDAIWVTYNLGQLLIVFSISAAANVVLAF